MLKHTLTALDLGYRVISAHQLGQSSTQPDRYGSLHYGPYFYPLVWLAGRSVVEGPSGCVVDASGAPLAFASEVEVCRFCAFRNRSEAQRVRYASRSSVEEVA